MVCISAASSCATFRRLSISSVTSTFRVPSPSHGANGASLKSPSRPEAASAPDFEPMLAALIEAVGAYRAAVLSGQPDAIKAARGRIKPAYARLFVKFG